MSGDVCHVAARRGQREDQAGVVGRALYVETAAVVDVFIHVLFNGFVILAGDVASAAGETEYQPFAAESGQLFIVVLLNVVAGDRVDVKLLLVVLYYCRIGALGLKESVAVRDLALVRLTQTVVGLARGGDLIRTVLCDGADSVNELYDVVRRIRRGHAGELCVVVGIEEHDVVAVFKVVLRHDDIGYRTVDGVHPAGVFAAVFLAEHAAVRPDNAGHKAAADSAVAVLGKCSAEHIVDGHAFVELVIFGAEPHAAVVAEREADGQVFVVGLIGSGVGAGDGEFDRDRLTVEQLEELIVGVELCVLAVGLA